MRVGDLRRDKHRPTRQSVNDTRAIKAGHGLHERHRLSPIAWVDRNGLAPYPALLLIHPLLPHFDSAMHAINPRSAKPIRNPEIQNMTAPPMFGSPYSQRLVRAKPKQFLVPGLGGGNVNPASLATGGA